MKKNHFLFFLLMLILLGTGTAYYWYQKPVPSLDAKEADYTITAKELFTDYQANEQKSNDLYLGKLVQVEGLVKNLVTEGDQLSVILDSGETSGGIVCEMDKKMSTQAYLPRKGQAVTMKGECSGMLFDVVLVRCVIIA